MIASNEYFDGKVKSLGYETATGKYTVGVMEAGDYEFGTGSGEEMIVVDGVLEVLLPGKESWESYSAGKSFNVPSGVKFKVKAVVNTAYLCRYY